MRTFNRQKINEDAISKFNNIALTPRLPNNKIFFKINDFFFEIKSFMFNLLTYYFLK